MKKFSVKIAITTILLIFGLFCYNYYLFNFVEQNKASEYTQRLIDNIDKDYIKNTLDFALSPQAYKESGFDSESDYMNLIASSLGGYGFTGYVSPSKTYASKANVNIEGVSPKLYSLEKSYFDAYKFKVEKKATEFNYQPATIEDVTVYLGYPYKEILGNRDTVKILIAQKEDSKQTYEITAKVAGYIMPEQYDVVNQTEVFNTCYIGDIQKLFEKEIVYNNSYRLYTLCFTNLETHTDGIKQALSGKGEISSYNYTAKLTEKIQSVKNSMPFDIIFLVIIGFVLLFLFVLAGYFAMRIYTDYNIDENKKSFSAKLIISICSLFMVVVAYLIFNFTVGVIGNVFALIIPYVLIVITMLIAILYNMIMIKRRLKND